MAKNQAYLDAINGTGDGAFQYGGYENSSPNIGFGFGALDGLTKSSNEARALQNWRLKNEQTAFNNQQGMLKNLMTGGAGGGAVGAPSTENRFAAGLSDAEMRLKSLLDNPDSINQSGAYKFRVKQGEDAIQRQMGARGMLNSGNRLMELTKYGQDMGSQEYDAQYGRLSGLLGNYSQGWLGDKNANTAVYSAQNTAKANNDRNALGWASLWADQNKATSTGGSRSGGGMSSNIYGYGQPAPSAWSDVLQNDIAEAKLKQVRGY